MKCVIRVIVRNAATDETVHDRVGDHNDPKFRQWMGSTAFWAFRNNHYMMTGPMDRKEQDK